MLRLSLVFCVWLASTAYAFEPAADNQEAEMHEAYAMAWSEADEQGRNLLERAQHGWNQYRAATCALLGEECYALMAQERAAELRHLLMETNGRTILPAQGRASLQR
jgi:uncharacterized protein YecT (DUF1311 family)